VARPDDAPVVLVSHTLPGETVLAEVTERRKNYWRAMAVEVLEASADRVALPWAEAGPFGVGGMDMGHVAPAAARLAKAEVVAGQVAHLGGVSVPDGFVVEPVGDGAVLGWRTSVDLTADGAGRLGMFGARSGVVVPLATMPLAVPAIGALDLFGRVWPAGARVRAVAPSAGGAKAFWLVKGVDSGVRAEAVGEWRYRVDAWGFWQEHRLAPQTLVEAVLAAARAVAAPGAVVWDLYAGAGLFTLPLADAIGQAGVVVAVEGGRQAALDLAANAASRPQVKARRGDVGGWLAKGLARRPDMVVLDPPRKGAGRAVMEALGAAGPKRMVYVACEPSALGRDIGLARAAGYRLSGLRAFDLFPGTHHVECVAVLDK
jgi:tRNA/tmRNA/rRNA uracil-C5-methylase (TrmA/RlmC/RlmD family)